MHHLKCTTGQALVELVITLVALIILILGVTTLAHISLRQTILQRETRLEAGQSALERATQGWADTNPLPENRADTFHRINGLTRLDQYSPALTSRLPMSHYTLSARTFSEGDLGLEETTLQQTIPLDEAFIRWIYGKGTVTLKSAVTFPALSGLAE
ncbi:MAG: hypothetical protein IJV69_08190 [Kiritimatiellae bacterium]|nr:hypothetical protein [Kiritimatiellia bacterium]